MTPLDPERWDAFFGPFRHLTVGVYEPNRHLSDVLVARAVWPLLEHFRVRRRKITPAELNARAFVSLPDVVLVAGADDDETAAPEIMGVRTVLAGRFDPDPVFFLSPAWVDEGVEAETGLFLRTDAAGLFADDARSLGDPGEISGTPEDLFGLASKFEHVVTDHPYFAIVSRILDRRVTLLPDRTGGNQTRYLPWLRSNDTVWRQDLSDFSYNPGPLGERLWRRLAGPPSRIVPWQSCPVRRCDWRLDNDHQLLDEKELVKLRLDRVAAALWDLCDGSLTTEKIVEAFMRLYPDQALTVARDIQRTLQRLRDARAVTLEWNGYRAGHAPMRASRRHADLDIRPRRRIGGRVHVGAVLRTSSGGEYPLWYAVEERHAEHLTGRGDPFVLAALYRAMSEGADLRVTGAVVSRSLLRNLEEFQRAWTSWLQPLRMIRIEAEEVDETRGAPPAIVAFSGGVDSCYTVFRHCIEPDSARNRRVTAALMVHGFDIPVADRPGFDRALIRSGRVLADAGIELIPMATNLRGIEVDWDYSHGSLIASALTLFSGGYGAGLIGSTAPYNQFARWGSNPLTDWLLGGREFEIAHDGAGVQRIHKLESLTRWPAAIADLRVCWKSRDAGVNCGRCPKCLFTALSLMVLDAPLTCFERPPDGAALNEFLRHGRFGILERHDARYILDAAEHKGRRGDRVWLESLRQVAYPAPELGIPQTKSEGNHESGPGKTGSN